MNTPIPDDPFAFHESEIRRLEKELEAACQHVEALCKERTLYRDRARELEKVVEAARDYIENNCLRAHMKLNAALINLDEARRE